MNASVQRKDSIGTIGDAIEWLRRNPILIGLFFFYGILELFGELLGTLGAVIGLFSFLVLIYVDGVAHVIGQQEATGHGGDLGQASTVVLGQFVSLIGIFIVYGLVVFVGLLFFIIPGVYLAIRLSLAFPACVIDEEGAFESLSTSWSVAKGNLIKLFGITVLSLLIVGGVAVVTVLFTGLDGGFYLTFLAVSAVLTAVVSPVVQLAYARVYLENRPRSGSSSAADDRGEASTWGGTDDDSQTGSGDEWGTDTRDDDRW
ncbi:hypothetical protein GS429_01105 [Natronorubrum sp. JWXQ-INN-674]|uniref:Glycerophosphoryl diester phosphodiesterase membrane domain-containing protein n=1 Tax=Natronorubrum halalkaliphilum TaxID=2691917 RepID=A0A6B0VJA9_9EURY|nr:glycerophosphoryl diester phosphodiesterase membrane domain-containing protein [Natronorubrum halalkaliphilum]MXV60689.1 hypothetical protein [Natronorubrum halalkaliphilum]